MPYAKVAGTMLRSEAAAAVPYLRRALERSSDATPEERVFREEVEAALASALSTVPRPK
jgi:hypothetical protein